MTVLSTACQCSACKKKYGCQLYAKVVEMQRLTNRYISEPGIVLRFQVEDCNFRDVEGKK